MFSTFTDATGRREGLILAVGKNQIRLTVPGVGDAVELNRSHGRWVTDAGEAVELDFVDMGTEWMEPRTSNTRRTEAA